MSAGDTGGGAILSVDLDAVAANYRALAGKLAGAELGAVVKANAYGLGMAEVAPTLAAAGCHTFFVATADEGATLRQLLAAADIHVFNGFTAGDSALFAAHRLVPVLNSLADIDAWKSARDAGECAGPADLHLDTGMARLGLEPADAEALAGDSDRLDGLEIDLVMSHLACADETAHPLNGQQLAAFSRLAGLIPARRRSLSASSGLFLGPDYQFDLVRAGVALYGVNPAPNTPNAMAQVVRLQGKILQTRDVDTPQTVGYGATRRVAGKCRIATVAAGYADGYPRSLSDKGTAYIGEYRLPVVGRVSMDLVTLDITGVPPDIARPGALVDLIGAPNPVDRVAAEAGTIGYEILTGLGGRCRRIYLGGEAGGG